MRILTLIAMTVLSAAAVPAVAQDAMMAHGAMKMSAADQKKMDACGAMSHDKMMKNAGCKKLMKMHPDMMKGGDSMMAH